MCMPSAAAAEARGSNGRISPSSGGGLLGGPLSETVESFGRGSASLCDVPFSSNSLSPVYAFSRQ